MSELRMPKNWMHFASTDVDPFTARPKAERAKQDKVSNKMIRHQKRMSSEDLVKEAKSAYEVKEAAKVKRDLAIKEGRLKDNSKKTKKK